MMGLPLAPCHQFPANAPAAFFSLHALGDPNIVAELNDYIKTQRPVLMTDGLAKRLLGQVKISATNVQVLPVRATPDYLLTWPQAKLDEMRTPLLSALNANFRAPNQVAIYLYRPDGWVIENFNNEPVTVLLNGQSLTIAARGWTCHW
jgi:hypothetical protein